MSTKIKCFMNDCLYNDAKMNDRTKKIHVFGYCVMKDMVLSSQGKCKDYCNKEMD